MKTSTSILLAVLALATSACIGAAKGAGAEAATAPQSPMPERSDEARAAGAESVDRAGHAAASQPAATGAGRVLESPTHAHGAGLRPQGRTALQIGDEVEDIALTDSTGEAFQLATLRKTEKSRGKTAVLTFWCTTCSSCRGIERDFDAMAREYETQDALFLMIDSNHTDSAQRVNQFLESKELGFRVLMDSHSQLARYFGATLTTTTAVVDAEGRLRYYGGFAGAEDAVRNLIDGVEVAVPLKPGGG